jgi:hypothetical protein
MTRGVNSATGGGRIARRSRGVQWRRHKAGDDGAHQPGERPRRPRVLYHVLKVPHRRPHVRISLPPPVPFLRCCYICGACVLLCSGPWFARVLVGSVPTPDCLLLRSRYIFSHGSSQVMSMASSPEAWSVNAPVRRSKSYAECAIRDGFLNYARWPDRSAGVHNQLLVQWTLENDFIINRQVHSSRHVGRNECRHRR